MFDRVLSISWILTMLGLKYTRVKNISSLSRALYFEDSRLFWMFWVLNMLMFWMYQESKHGSRKEFWIKYHGFSSSKCYMIGGWWGSEYFSVFLEYGRVLNMPGFYKIYNKKLHYRYLIGFWICLQFLNDRVTESWRLCVNCVLRILEIHSLDCTLEINGIQVLNIPRFWMCPES